MITHFHDNRHLLGVTILIVLAAGVTAFFALPRLEDPRINNRNPVVLTIAPGVTADRVEALITEPLERALDEISEIKDVESTSRAGISALAIALKDEVRAGENERIFSKIRDRLASVEPELPPEASSPVLDDERDPAAFTLIVALTWDAAARDDVEPELGLLTRLASDLADGLRGVAGTEIVRLYGAVDEEVVVSLDASTAASLGVGAGDAARSLASADAKLAAGVVRAPHRDVRVEVAGSFDAIDRLRRVPITDASGGRLATVGDVATVERAWRTPVTEIGLTGGERAVFVAARMETGRRVGAWAERARGVVDGFRDVAGGGVTIDLTFDQSEYTVDRLRGLGFNLLLGALVVTLVVTITMGLRSSLIVALAIPVTTAAAMFGVLVGGGQLHQMSIFGMIIALGLLIDNAIVVVDEIRKRCDRGLPPRDALASTLRGLAAPLFASTLTTCLAFAPIVLLPGNAGDFVGSIGWSVILAVASSYALSMTVIAALAARFGRFGSTGGKPRRGGVLSGGVPGGPVARGFSRFLRAGLRAPVALLLVAAIPPAAGFAVAGSLGRQFFPPVDRDMFDVRVWLPERTPIDRTRSLVQEITAAANEWADVERTHWLVGGSFPSVYYNLSMNQDNASHYAQGVIEATSAEAVRTLVPDLQRRLDERFPGAQIVMRSFGQGPPVDAGVSFRIRGPSVASLQELGEQVRGRLQAHPDVLHTRTSLPRGEPQLTARVDEDLARFAGLPLREIAARLRDRLDGAVGGSLLEDVEELPVRVRVGDAERASVSDLASAELAGVGGSWTPLDALGPLELTPTNAGVTRFNARRANIIDGYTREDALPIDVTRAVQDRLDADGFELPPGYTLELGGSLEQDREAVADLMRAAPVLASIMLAALVLTFRSVRLAVVLVAVGGLSVGLALLSTWAIDFPVSFNTILGTFGLIGIAFNDSIVVLAAIRDDPRARAGDPDAIAEAVMGCSRHVVSTTLTTIGGFLPLLLLQGGEFWPSLAIVLAGGVSGATLLATVFVPAAYRVMVNTGSESPSQGNPSPASCASSTPECRDPRSDSP